MNLEPILAEVALFKGLSPRHLALIAGCASEVAYESGRYLGRLGDLADGFWVIREGRVAVQLSGSGRGAITVASMAEGDVVGFSWMVPPYHLQFDVHAVTDVRAILFDGRCLRGKFATDPELGHELLSRFARIMVNRIQAMSLQLLDIYGDHPVEQD